MHCTVYTSHFCYHYFIFRALSGTIACSTCWPTKTLRWYCVVQWSLTTWSPLKRKSPKKSSPQKLWRSSKHTSSEPNVSERTGPQKDNVFWSEETMTFLYRSCCHGDTYFLSTAYQHYCSFVTKLVFPFNNPLVDSNALKALVKTEEGYFTASFWLFF